MKTKRSIPGFMFAIFCGILLLMLSQNSEGQVLRKTSVKLDSKIQKAETRLDLIQGNPQTQIPKYVLNNAIGIIIIQQFKAGIGIGAEGGGGVAMVKNGETGQWSPPAFVANAEGSYGWQIGAQNAITVFCIMQNEGLKILQEGGGRFGVDVRATAGPNTAGGEAVMSNIKTPVLVYSNREGLFAGVALEGGGIIHAQRKNETYYGMTTRDVLFGGNAPWSDAGASLVNRLRGYAGEFDVTETNLLYEAPLNR